MKLLLSGTAVLLAIIGRQGASPLPADLQAFCERLAGRAPASAELRFVTGTVERTIELPGTPRLLGGQWDAVLKTLTVFESGDSRIAVLDSTGRVLRTLGRSGEGPAEFRLSPVVFGSRQRFRVAPDGRVLVVDERFGHLFAGNTQTQEVHFGGTMGPIPSDVHVARLRNVWLVSVGNVAFDDRAAASRVALFLVPDAAARRQDPALLATLSNGLMPIPGNGPAGYGMPYDRQRRRIWDAAGSGLAVLSHQRFALCAGSPTDSATWKAWAINAVRRRVDAAERDRLLIERFGKTSGPVPMAGTPIEEVYRGRWPATAPFYHDITHLNDSTYAAIRLDNATGVTADLVSVSRGYLRSVRLPANRGVIGGYRDGLLLLDAGEGLVELYRVP